MRFAPLLALMPSLAMAQEAADSAAAPASSASSYMSLLPLVLIFGIFYFLLIKPQQKRMRDHQGMLAELKKGDEVTVAGIVGRVVKLEDERTVVEIAKGIEVRVITSSITQVLTAEAKPTPVVTSKKSAKGTVKNDNAVPSKDQVANDN